MGSLTAAAGLKTRTYILGELILDDSLLLWHTSGLGAGGDAESASLSDGVRPDTFVRGPHVLWQHCVFIQLGHSTYFIKLVNHGRTAGGLTMD